MNNTISRLSRMTVGNGTFRSELKEILQNKYVLYAILIIAILNVIGYLALKNMDAVLFFILTVLLSMYFTRNMIVVLFIAIIATNFYSGTRGILASKQEGLENKKDKKTSANGDAASSEESGETGEGEDTDSGAEETSTVENVENMKEDAPADKPSSASTTATTANDAAKEDKPAEKKDGKAKTKAGMQNLKPAKFKPSKNHSGDTEEEDDEDDDDDGHAKVSGAKGNRVDYAQTLGQAYDNLQNIVGKDGVKGLTNQTKDLMEQQKVLMNNMKDMEPLIKSAQGFMSQIMGSGGLDGISKMFDGKLFGAVAPTVAENGKSLDAKK
jgi:hypothetical protein